MDTLYTYVRRESCNVFKHRFHQQPQGSLIYFAISFNTISLQVNKVHDKTVFFVVTVK